MSNPECRSRQLFVIGAVMVLAGIFSVVLLVRNPEAETTAPPAPDISVSEPQPPVHTTAGRESVALSWKFQRDEDGRITETTDPAGRVTTIRYKLDAERNVLVLTRQSPDCTITVEFDRYGRRIALTDAAGRVTTEYDGLGRPIAVKRDGSPATRYEYDPHDRIAAFHVGDDYTLGYTYGFLGRLEAVETPAGRITYTYSAKDRAVRRILPNGVVTTWHRGPDGALVRIEHTAAGKVVAAFAYEYRPDGLIAAVKETTSEGEHRIAYEYDPVGRLVAATDSRGPKWAYRYDLVGNRLEAAENGRPAIASAFDWFGRIVRHRGEGCTHDAAGCVARYPGSNGSLALTHSAGGQLVSAKADGVAVECKYDGDGNLIAREVNGQATTFVPDPLAGVWHPLVATGPGGERTEYLWDGDAPLAEKVNGEWRFLLHNHQDSVRCVVDGRGRVVERSEYCPFGRPLGGAGGGFRPGFAGLFFDPQTGLYHTLARAYDPALGRFLSIDPQHRVPTGSQKDLVPYSYCGGDPVNFVDLNGCEPQRFVVNHGGTVKVPVFPSAPTPNREVRAFLSFIPRSANEAALLVNFGNWAGGNRAPAVGLSVPANERTWEKWAAQQNLPRWIDPADRGAFYHDLRLQQLNAQNPRSLLFARLTDLSVGITHYQLAVTLDAAKHNPETTVAGKAFASGGSLFFHGLAKASFWLSGTGFGYETRLGTGSSLALTRAADARPGGTTPAWGWFADHLASVAPVSTGTKLAYSRAGSLSDLWEIENGGGSTRGPSGGGLSPTPVGGVALAGGGHALAGLGPIEGVSVDTHGRLVLVSRGKGGIELPPLRLDDVVTVFHCVYAHGSAPYVSIDPVPENPQGPVMNIRHGPGTADTYVGWVLFEADRVMKRYSLGKDNESKQEFRSKIDGYDKYIEIRFDGAGGHRDNLWERFWIVPDSVTHRHSKNGRTSLVSVPLKLRTEAMVMRGGRLVPAVGGQSSKGAQVFTKWFTDNYEKIASEAVSDTPKESGVEAKVPVFAELQRIAVIAAIAERLLEQGIPMPAWMRDYPVRPFRFPATTPSTTIESVKRSGNQVVTYSVYGGVILSPPRGAVKAEESPEVEALADPVRDAVAGVAPLHASPVGKDGRAVTALPPPVALGVGANRLAETDLRVPFGGRELSLVRVADSFHAPGGAFGSAWTLDLPRLVPRLGTPGEKPNTRNVYYELVSPLQSVAAVFAQIRHVPEVNGQIYVPADAGEILGLADSKKDFGTRVVLFRDCRKWHFDDAGDLAAVEELPVTVRFRRGKDRRVEAIEATCGSDWATIRLEYDADGRVKRAVGSDKIVANYAYDGGQLRSVEHPGGKVGYEYRGHLVTAVLREGAMARRFDYDAAGRLCSGRRGTDPPVTFVVSSDRDGTTVTAAGAGVKDEGRFDAHLNPVRQTLAGGRLDWKYAVDGSTEVTVSSVGEPPVVVKRSADGRRAEWHVAGLRPQIAEYDAAGRLHTLVDGERVVLRRSWRPDGLPESESDGATECRFEYRRDGTPAAVRVEPVRGGPEGGVRVAFDAAGRPAAVTDETGAVMRIEYDADGRVTGVTAPGVTARLRFGENVRSLSLKTDWGWEETADYDPGTRLPRRVEVKSGGEAASAEFDGGRPLRVRQFGGGEFAFTYPARPGGPPVQIRTPNGLVLHYRHDEIGRHVGAEAVVGSPVLSSGLGGGRMRLQRVECGGTCRVEYEFDAQDRLIGLKYQTAEP